MDWAARKAGLSLSGPFNSLSFARAQYFPHYIEPARKLMGFAKIWNRGISDIGLIYCELFVQARDIEPDRVLVPALAAPVNKVNCTS